LFDFNGLRSLSRTDLEFMFLSAYTAAAKVLSWSTEVNFI
jgi:hypothetical protein